MKSTSTKGSSKLNPRNFMQRVLSKTSTSTTSDSKTSLVAEKSLLEGQTEKSPVDFQNELTELKQQIDGLQISVTQMQSENENKEKSLAALARDKEQLSIDLKKQRRSNANLKQQLEDERNFYYKEKEQFCSEMNSYKKFKRKLMHKENSIRESEKSRGLHKDVSNNYKKEISELKNTLNQTLEANFNLSVKFLRMKNTKFSLAKQLKKLTEKYEVSRKSLTDQIETVRNELDDMSEEYFYKPIPPSNKKYLLVLKQNGALVHENLRLQFEIDQLMMDMERFKLQAIKDETKSKLKFMHRFNSSLNNCTDSRYCSKKSERTRSASTAGTSAATTAEESVKKLIRVKSRSSQTDASLRRRSYTTSKHRNRHEETDSLIKNDSLIFREKVEDLADVNKFKADDEDVSDDRASSKFDLMTFSNSNMSASKDSHFSSGKNIESLRTQSAPEIVRSASSSLN